MVEIGSVLSPWTFGARSLKIKLAAKSNLSAAILQGQYLSQGNTTGGTQPGLSGRQWTKIGHNISIV